MSNETGVRNPQEQVSVLSETECPLSAGLGVRFQQD
jgi:hypothetical protein